MCSHCERLLHPLCLQPPALFVDTMPSSAWECPSCGEANTVRTALCSDMHTIVVLSCLSQYMPAVLAHPCGTWLQPLRASQTSATRSGSLKCHCLFSVGKVQAGGPLCAPAATTRTTATFVYCQAEDGSSEAVDKEQQVERMGLTPDWIIQATAFKVFQLAPPTPEQPFIRGLLDPCTNSMLAPNIPAEKLYDKVVSFGRFSSAALHQGPGSSCTACMSSCVTALASLAATQQTCCAYRRVLPAFPFRRRGEGSCCCAARREKERKDYTVWR